MGTKKIIPERTAASLAGLIRLCQFLNRRGLAGTLVEVGGWTGAGTAVFVRHFAKVYVVDPWDPTQGEIAGEGQVAQAEALFDRRHGADPRVVKYRLTSAAAARDLPGTDVFDAVYLDGLHAYGHVLADIESWLPRVRRRGVLCGHDYHPEKFPDVCRAVRHFFPADRVKLFPDTSWAVELT